jgi:hypothetical protein
MCWTAGASLALGTAGVGVAAYGHAKGKSPYITIPLVYFSLMEFLQFFSYFWINQCTFESNTALTFLSYVHIAFQPIFINMAFMALSPQGISKISKFTKQIVFGISVLVAIILLIKIMPIYPESLCAPGQTLCGTNMCTQSGSWHLAWLVPQYNFPIPGDGMLYYGFAAFIVPLLYGGWFGALILAITGPALAYILASGNPNEWPAIWCLYSVALILITLWHVWRAPSKRKARK